MSVHRLSPSEAGAGRVTIRYGESGVAWLSLPPRSVGLAHLEPALIRDLHEAISDIQDAIEDGRVGALVLAEVSAAAAGRAGLASLLKAQDGPALVAEVISTQATLRRLELLPIPTIAAIEGECIGAVLELALACSYRLATIESSARFALPQIRLGLIPGLGGTVRLPRLVGVQAALDFILRGEVVSGERAKAIGLVDGLISTGRFRESVTRFAEDRVQRGRLRTRARRRLPRRLLEDTAPGRRLLISRAARAAGAQRNAQDAQRAVLQTVVDGLSLPLEEAFTREAELYGRLLAADTSKALIQAALLEGDATHPHPHGRSGVERVGILGADRRASDLAWGFARRGIAVRLKAQDRALLATTAASLASRLATRTDRAGLRRYSADPRPARLIDAAVGFGGFGALQLVLSPVDEPDAAASQLAEAERHVTPDCLLATASALVQVADFEGTLRNPSRALAIVPSEAPHVFPAVEIAGGSATSKEAIATACELVRGLGGTPIHVGDHPGFLIHRMVAIFLWQAAVMVEEGVGLGRVDEVAEAFGFRMGPFKRADAVGPDGVRRLLMVMPAPISGTEPIPPLLAWVAQRDVRFYRYRGGRATRVNPDLPIAGPNPADADAGREVILERLVLAVLNEVARSLDEGVVASSADADLAAVFGLGYPRARGGLLFQADRLGPREILSRLERLAEAHGVGFTPAPLVRALAASGEGFHPPR